MSPCGGIPNGRGVTDRTVDRGGTWRNRRGLTDSESDSVPGEAARSAAALGLAPQGLVHRLFQVLHVDRLAEEPHPAIAGLILVALRRRSADQDHAQSR